MDVPVRPHVLPSPWTVSDSGANRGKAFIASASTDKASRFIERG